MPHWVWLNIALHRAELSLTWHSFLSQHRGCLREQKEKVHSFPGHPPRGNMTILNISGFNQSLGTKNVPRIFVHTFYNLSILFSIYNEPAVGFV